MEEKPITGAKWLRKLIRESWQAELIISGVALFGTLQLPGLLEWFQHYILLNADGSVLFAWFMATVYWAVFVYGLVVLFIYHFVLRTLWIGLLGLKSRYPNGIAKTSLSSEDFQDKMIAEYGDLDGYIVELDQKASSVYGSGLTAAGIFFNIGLILSLGIIVVSLLQRVGLDKQYAYLLALLPLGLVLVIGFVSSLFNLKSLRDKDWVKRYHFPMNRLMNRFIIPVNHRFTVLGLTLTSSNGVVEKYGKEVKTKDVIGSFLVFFVGCGLIGALLGFTDVVKSEFNDNFYWRMGRDPSYADRKNYGDSGYDGVLYEPLIERRELTAGRPLNVWVPLPERELSVMLDSCTIAPVEDDELTRNEERLAESRRERACAAEYVEMYLEEDGRRLPLPEALLHHRSSGGFSQSGALFTFTDLTLPAGRHTLRVETRYTIEDDDAPGGRSGNRTTYIPFFIVAGT